MSEAELESEIRQYKDQLAQIEAAINTTESENQELLNIKVDLEDILKLTEESLVEIKKQKLLDELSLLESNLGAEVTNNNDRPNTSAKSAESTENDIDLVGSKCRVFYNCENTSLKMHNALILGVDLSQEDSVRVLFCNPTHMSMKICDHFMNDTCRFNDKCKYSHGYRVNLDDIHSYLEPNYESLRVGCSCLAKHSDDLWHLASIESLDEENICVQYKKFNLKTALTWSDVYPLDNPHDESTDDDDLLTTSSDSELSQEDAEQNRPYHYSKHSNSDALGNWEKHTKGIGSKLMAKMGYVYGQGLGKDGEGRIQPIDVFVLPEGQHISLDKVMELKEKKLLKKRKFEAKKDSKDQQTTEKDEMNVFEFINQTLLVKDKVDKTSEKSKATASSLNQANSKGLNIKMLETHNRIQDIEKTIAKLKQSLIRNQNSEKSTIDQIKQRLAENESVLGKLKKAESDILTEKNNRKKKNDIF